MPNSIKDWITYVKDKPIPVLSRTAIQLQNLCSKDDAPVQGIVSIVEQDPGLTTQLLRHCNHTDGHKLDREITSVQQAIMLVGTERLGKICNGLPLLDKNLSAQAQQQVLRTFCRANHAGRQAVYWAQQRRDMTPDEVFAATQLHYLGEMILAIHAPEQLLAAFTLRREKNISSEEAQYLSLGFTLDQLSLAIAEAWQLPLLVREALQSENASNPRGFSIMMAVQLSRIATIDWYSDKMTGIYKHMSELLNISMADISRQTHKLAIEIAQANQYTGVLQAAALLPRLKDVDSPSHVKQTIAKDYQADICLMPQVNILRATVEKLRSAVKSRQDKSKLLNICLQGLHDGIGLNRVVFATLDSEKTHLFAAASIGSDNDPVFNQFNIPLHNKDLFGMLLKKSQAICINDSNRKKFWTLVPEEFQKLIGTNSFVAMSIFFNNAPVGIMYADRHTSSCQVDESSYQYFKKLCRSYSDAVVMTK